MAWRNLILVGVGVFAVTSLVTAVAAAPASVFLTEDARAVVTDASGTVWDGAAALPGGLEARRRFAPIASLSSGRLAFDIDITGPSASARLTAGVRPDSLQLSDVEGRGDASLFALLANDEGPECTAAGRISASEIVISPGRLTAQGDIVFEAGRCLIGGREIEHPALRLIAEGERGRLLTTAEETLARFEVRDARLAVTWTQAGLDVFAPGRTRPLIIEIDL